MRAARCARTQAGTASVEIVVMLPVMIVLFAAVYHFYSLGRAELTTSQSARACVWQYTMSGCRSEGALCQGLTPEGDGDVEQKAANQGKEPEPEDGRYKHAKDSSKSVLEKATQIPVVRQLVELLFGKVASVSASMSVPKFRSEERSKTTNTLYLVCNTVPESWGDKIKASICDMAEKIVGSGLPGC